MGICKLITLFSLITLSLCASFSTNHSGLKTSTPYSHNYGLFKEINNSNKNLNECFCYLLKQTGIPINQILNSGGGDLERLALYLYRDPTSKDIKIFLPNKEKQTMIPDLEFDEGDHLEISSSENIRRLFDHFPNLITKIESDELPEIAQILRPDNINTKINNSPINTLDPIRYFNNYKEQQNILQNMHNEVINQEKVEPLIYNNNFNNNHQILIETATDTSNLLHLMPVETNMSGEKIETVQPNILPLITVTENQIENQNIDESISDEDINYSEEFGEIEETESKPYIMPIHNVMPNTNSIVEIETEQPTIYGESTPAPEMYTIKPDTNEISLNGLDFTKLPFISIGGADDQKFEPIQIYSQNQSPHEQQWHYNKEWLKLPNLDVPNSNHVENNIQNPFISNNIKKSENPLQIPLHINNNVMPGKSPWAVHPVKYIKQKITPDEDVSPQDISIIAMRPETLFKKYQGTNNIDLHDTFDNWFDKQMKRVQFTNSKASNLLDIYTFKYLIEKTLREKGMYITQEGLIIDSEGNVLQTSNLVLTPILIGNSVQYKNLMQGKFSTFKLPTELPYLEAVLITSINPPIILGIIPLGKTYLPENYRKSLSLYVDEDRSSNNICNGCNHQHKIIMPSVNTKQTEGYFALPGYKILQPKISTNQYSHRIFPFDEINTVIDKIYKIPISGDKIVSLPHHYIVDTSPIISSRPIVEVPLKSAKVSPKFRIIGGNPATSSGTPLNNKGRLGDESSETNVDSSDSEIKID